MWTKVLRRPKNVLWPPGIKTKRIRINVNLGRKILKFEFTSPTTYVQRLHKYRWGRIENCFRTCTIIHRVYSTKYFCTKKLERNIVQYFQGEENVRSSGLEHSMGYRFCIYSKMNNNYFKNCTANNECPSIQVIREILILPLPMRLRCPS